MTLTSVRFFYYSCKKLAGKFEGKECFCLHCYTCFVSHGLNEEVIQVLVTIKPSNSVMCYKYQNHAKSRVKMSQRAELALDQHLAHASCVFFMGRVGLGGREPGTSKLIIQVKRKQLLSRCNYTALQFWLEVPAKREIWKIFRSCLLVLLQLLYSNEQSCNMQIQAKLVVSPQYTL